MIKTEKNYDFFISHSRETKQMIAIPLTEYLTKLGFNVWLDRKGIPIGEHIYNNIEKGISQSTYCIALIDRFFLKRQWPLTEIDLFHKKYTGKILPVFIDVEKEDVFKVIPWLDGIAYEKLDFTHPNNNVNFFCRLLDRFYKDNIRNPENSYKNLLKCDFPCKDSLVTLMSVKESYSQDLLFAILDLCNIAGVIYAIHNSLSSYLDKVISITFKFSNILRDYCFNSPITLTYDIYVAIHDAVFVSLEHLYNVLASH
mgnify:FL=1